MQLIIQAIDVFFKHCFVFYVPLCAGVRLLINVPLLFADRCAGQLIAARVVSE